jgi:N-acetylglucosamine-6-phosphate deacetylase
MIDSRDTINFKTGAGRQASSLTTCMISVGATELLNGYAFINGTVISPDTLLSGAAVLVRDGAIAHVGSLDRIPEDLQTVDCTGRYLAPGFVDIHVHGGSGADFMDGTTEAVRIACHAHLRHGTTTIFPTTTTGSKEQILAMLSACQQVASQSRGPFLAGVHLYGPYFADDKVGCHRREGCRQPESHEFESYLDSGIVRIATCAAELPGADQFYDAARARNCLITCGHSNASWTEMQAAFERGMRHVDHFWCAMSSIPSLRQRFSVPMQASMAEYVLMNEAMSTEVIADGMHLAPELLQFAYKMLTPQRLCLVTDCNRALDMPPGEYLFGDVEDGNRFYSDGQVGWTVDRSRLASSVVGMDHMVRHFKKHTTATLPEVIRMASLTPAQRTGIDRYVGSIESGKRADLLLLDDNLAVQQVFVGGKMIS